MCRTPLLLLFVVLYRSYSVLLFGCFSEARLSRHNASHNTQHTADNTALMCVEPLCVLSEHLCVLSAYACCGLHNDTQRHTPQTTYHTPHTTQTLLVLSPYVCWALIRFQPLCLLSPYVRWAFMCVEPLCMCVEPLCAWGPYVCWALVCFEPLCELILLYLLLLSIINGA